MSKIRKFMQWLVSAVIVFIGSTSLTFAEDGTCHGRFLNPIAEINWNLILPIKIAGVPFAYGVGSNESPLATTSPMCICPGRLFGYPTPGIMATFHEPLYIEEIARIAGCFSSIGGKRILSGYDMQNMSLDLDASQGDIARWQVHWYTYPVFKLLKLFQDFACVQSDGGYALAYITELDPTWQNDEWGAVFNPEAILFANPIAQAACIIDAISSTAYLPLDPLFWCAGSWGGVYPFTGNANANSDRLQSAYLVGAKLIAKLSRVGMLWDTVGQWAMCSPVPSAMWIKSQFTIDPVYPMVKEGIGVPIGAAPIVYLTAPPQSYPMFENVTNVIFQQQQCCMHI
jgi:conjugal transfer pilus assembly protein TraU